MVLDAAFRAQSASATGGEYPPDWTHFTLSMLDENQRWFGPGFFESTDLVNPFGPLFLADHGQPTAAGVAPEAGIRGLPF